MPNPTQPTLLTSGLTTAGVLSDIFPLDKQAAIIDQLAWTDDERWMLRAFRVGMRTLGQPAPNPTVGCVFVKDGLELSSGSTATYGSDHAETAAINHLSDRSLLRGSTAYVTLEPCAHHGKTPPCVDALIATGIARCVIAMRDPNPLVAGLGIKRLSAAGIAVVEGVLGEFAQAWHQPFITHIKEKRLFIALKWAQTLDGCLCDDERGSQWISGPVAKTYTHWLRQRYDAIAIGAQTYLNDKPQLNVREVPSWVKARQPLCIVFDLDDQIPALDATSPHGKTIHIKPGKNGFSVLSANRAILTVDRQGLDLSPMTQALATEEVSQFHGKPLQSLLVEAGPNLLAAFVEQSSFDIAHCYISPSFLGAKKLSLASLVPAANIAHLRKGRVIARASLGNDTLLEFCPPEACQPS